VNWYPERTIRKDVEMRSICPAEEDSVDIWADRTTWQVTTVCEDLQKGQGYISYGLGMLLGWS
jgi:hypothetical protein